MAVAAMLTASAQAVAAASPPAMSAQPAGEPKWVPGELMVRFRPGVGAARRAAVRADEDAQLRKSLPLSGLELLRLAPGDSVRAAAAEFEDDPDVMYAEPNFYYELDAVPNDPRFSELWGLHNTGQLVNGSAGTADADIDAPEAWETTTGSASVTVGVVDSGVAYDHPDLAANIWTNPGEIAGNGIDDDGNRLVDDVHGWDFIDSDNSPRDVVGHGTHVAGTIAARGNNGQGVAGVNWNSSVMPVRACTVDGCATSAIVSAFFYAAGKGARVVNASLGGPNFSQAMRDVINVSPDTLFVVSAGNDGLNLDAPGVDDFPCEIARGQRGLRGRYRPARRARELLQLRRCGGRSRGPRGQRPQSVRRPRHRLQRRLRGRHRRHLDHRGHQQHVGAHERARAERQLQPGRLARRQLPEQHRQLRPNQRRSASPAGRTARSRTSSGSPASSRTMVWSSSARRTRSTGPRCAG